MMRATYQRPVSFGIRNGLTMSAANATPPALRATRNAAGPSGPPIEEHQSHEGDDGQVGWRAGVRTRGCVEAVDVEVTESHSCGHGEEHCHRHVRNPEVAIRQDDNAEGSPGRHHVGQRVEVGAECTLLAGAPRRPLGHRAVDDVEDESAHEADGGPLGRAPHGQRDRQDAGCKPGESEQIGGVGEVGQDSWSRQSGVASRIGDR